MRSKQSISLTERVTADNNISVLPNTITAMMCQSEAVNMDRVKVLTVLDPKLRGLGSATEDIDDLNYPSHTSTMDCRVENVLSDACHDLVSNLTVESGYLNQSNESEGDSILSSRADNLPPDLQEAKGAEERLQGEITELTKDGNCKKDGTDENELSSEYFSATNGTHSILVYFSSHCVSKGTVCEHSRLLRIKFYGSDDKPLGRYLHENLFDQVTHCLFVLFVRQLFFLFFCW